jgi:hypothetical protein
MLTAAANVSDPDDVMAIVPTVRFNWLPRQTLYAEAQTRTARQQALRQQQDYLSAASDILAAAATNSASGMSNLAAQAALTRIQAAAKAKAQEQAKLASNSLKNPSTLPNTLSPPKSVTLPDGSKINVDPAIYLDGGSKLNVSTGTITFPDGTIIDTKTGVKKVNVTV